MQRFSSSSLVVFVCLSLLLLIAPPMQAAATTSTQHAKAKVAKKPATAKKTTAKAEGGAPKKAAVKKSTKSGAAHAKTALAKKPAAKHKSAARHTASVKKRTRTRASVPASPQQLSDIERAISSRSVLVMDAKSGETLFAKSPDVPRQPASTIKIVTAMIALKSLRNDDIINVSRHAAGMPCSKVFLDPGKDYRANDLINAVLLASANDAAVALGEKIAGSEDKFAQLMTLSARMWGAQNTICRTASGLTAEGQQTTARDLAHLMRYAMQHEEFARRMRERAIRTSWGKVLRNHNKALWRVDGAVGGKTGYTVAARQTYVGQFTRDGQTIVVAIMGSETMWADLAKLVEYGFHKKKEEQLAQGHAGRAGADRLN